MDLRWAATLLFAASVGTVLAVAVKLPYYAFFAPTRDKAAVTTRLPWGMYAAMGAGAVLSIAVGVLPGAASDVFGLHVEHAAYTTATIVSGLQVLALSADRARGSSLPKLAGRDTVTLDADWMYRKAGHPVNALVLKPLEAVFTVAQTGATWTVRVTTRLHRKAGAGVGVGEPAAAGNGGGGAHRDVRRRSPRRRALVNWPGVGSGRVG